MALETGTYISDLVSTNPASSDNISQGDDHIRLLKSTIKATFPNITGAVTPTQADLNKLTSSGSPQFSTIELGAASDTTISRVSAGLIAVEGGNVPLENRANTFTANQIISVTDNTNAALRITQLGTGAAIRVEDEANPDSTPFIVDANGNVGVGTASPGAKLSITPTVADSANVVGKIRLYDQAGSIVGFGVSAGQLEYRADGAAHVWYNGTSEKMRLDSNGSLGIGATPGAKITLGGGATDQYINREVNTGALIMTGGTGIVGGPASAGIVLRGETSSYNPKCIEFFANGAERMKLAADGTLYVNSANINMQVSDSGLCWGDFSTAVIGNAVSDYVKVITAGTEKFSVASNGTLNSQATYDNTATGSTVVVTSTGALRRTSSSIKYKKDVETLDHSLADNAIANLRPVWYRTKNAEGDDKASWSHIGLIAEEVDLVEKRLVRYKTAEVTYDENGNKVETPLETPEPEDVDYARLSVLLLDKVQRMDATIKALEARIAALEAA